ncbi:hypothetical protein HanIR_Chr13g0639391 [Helianthus annuus]|nr:hypothetical protein HanIR_Chr13g0639391 [Helianthus annuus]
MTGNISKLKRNKRRLKKVNSRCTKLNKKLYFNLPQVYESHIFALFSTTEFAYIIKPID